MAGWWSSLHRDLVKKESFHLPVCEPLRIAKNRVIKSKARSTKRPIQPSRSPSLVSGSSTWYLVWDDDIQVKVLDKENFSHKFLISLGYTYKNSNREPKKVNAVIRSAHCKYLYDKLDIRDGEKNLYQFAKSLHHHTQYIYTSVAYMTSPFFAYRLTRRDGWMARIFQIDFNKRISSSLLYLYLEQFHLSV